MKWPLDFEFECSELQSLWSVLSTTWPRWFQDIKSNLVVHLLHSQMMIVIFTPCYSSDFSFIFCKSLFVPSFWVISLHVLIHWTGPGPRKNWTLGPSRTRTEKNFKIWYRTGPGQRQISKARIEPTKIWKSRTDSDRSVPKTGGPWISAPPGTWVRISIILAE